MRRLARMKSQITIYLIIGIVIFSIFGALFYVSSQSKKDQLETGGTDQLTALAITKTQLENILRDCLQISTDDALYFAGVQSGHIFRDQGGQDIRANGIITYDSGTELMVPFGIVRSQGEVTPPTYPIPYGPDGYRYTLEDLEQNKPGVYLFGGRELPRLCDLKGPNSPTTNSCHISTYGTGNNTIQSKVRNAIFKNVKECLARQGSELAKLSDSVNVATESIEVILTDEDVRTSLELNSTLDTGGERVEVVRISYTAPVRLKRIYNMMFFLLQMDITDANFDKEVHFTNVTLCNYPEGVQCWDENMQISVSRDVSPEAHKGADMVTITDSKSFINGRPFRFQTAIQNRRPMLDYIHSSTGEPRVDLKFDPSQKIFIRPKAYDPDEDLMYTTYAGWKELGFMTSEAYRTAHEDCNRKDTWCASYNLKNMAPDLEGVRVSVFDEHDLYDFQPVFIRIGEPEDDPENFCPPKPAGYEERSCLTTESECRCDRSSGDNPEYCVQKEASKPMICSDGALCCQEITSGSAQLTCIGADCYQRSTEGDLDMTCTAGANCFQESVTGDVNQVCRDDPTMCMQEVDSGKGTVDCDGARECRQENNKGELDGSYGSCDIASVLANTQGNTLRICQLYP